MACWVKLVVPIALLGRSASTSSPKLGAHLEHRVSDLRWPLARCPHGKALPVLGLYIS